MNIWRRKTFKQNIKVSFQTYLMSFIQIWLPRYILSMSGICIVWVTSAGVRSNARSPLLIPTDMTDASAAFGMARQFISKYSHLRLTVKPCMFVAIKVYIFLKSTLYRCHFDSFPYGSCKCKTWKNTVCPINRVAGAQRLCFPVLVARRHLIVLRHAEVTTFGKSTTGWVVVEWGRNELFWSSGFIAHKTLTLILSYELLPFAWLK